MKFSATIALTAALFLSAKQADASIQGVPVSGSTSTTQVGTVLPNGNIEYFIPLSSDGSTSGTYGVTAVSGGIAGTFSDVGYGYGYYPSSALDVYLRYDLSSEFNPSAASSLQFKFVDLDLWGINDPRAFFETMQISYLDDAGVEMPLTDVLVDTASGFGFVAPGVTANISFGGENDPVTIDFTGMENIINGIADAGGLYEDEFYLRVYFGSWSYYLRQNTPEEFMTTLTTQGSPPPPRHVPEPGAAMIWLLLGVTATTIGRRRSR